MTVVEIAAVVATRDGVVVPVFTEVDGAADYTLSNDGNVLLYAEGSGALDVVPQKSYGGLALADLRITVEGSQWYGPFPPAVFNDDADLVHVEYVSGSLDVYALGL